MSRLQFVPRYLFASTFNFLTGKPMNSSRNARSALKACQSALLLPLLFVLLPAGAQAQATFGLQPVGIASGSQNVTVTASAAGTVANIEVLTTGAPGLDFTAAAAGASTCTSASLSLGSTCVQSVTFTPTAPGLRLGAVVLLSGNGSILATKLISGTGQGGFDGVADEVPEDLPHLLAVAVQVARVVAPAVDRVSTRRQHRSSRPRRGVTNRHPPD